MEAVMIAGPYGSPGANLYDPAMAKTERLGVEAVRKILGKRVDLAREQGIHTVLAKRNVDEAVIVPMSWYREARAALGEPTDL